MREQDVQHVIEALRLLTVHVQNANARPNPPEPWHAPAVTDLPGWARAGQGSAASEFGFFLQGAQEAYASGQVAVHIDCTGEASVLAGRLFRGESCPYGLAKAWGTPLPIDGVASKQIHGLPIGQRQLASLSLSAEKALGKAGKDKLRVVLTVDPEEEECVVADIRSRNFYGTDTTRIPPCSHAERSVSFADLSAQNERLRCQMRSSFSAAAFQGSSGRTW